MWVCRGCKMLVTLQVAEPAIDDDGLLHQPRMYVTAATRWWPSRASTLTIPWSWSSPMSRLYCRVARFGRYTN